MFNVECPFRYEFKHLVKCLYMDRNGICTDIEIGPGNGDAWCSTKIRAAIDAEKGVIDLGAVDISEAKIPENLPSFFDASVKLDATMRQNYMCHVCGLKSFVHHTKEEDIFDITDKIDKDHKQREPKCPNPVGDITMVGEATEI